MSERSETKRVERAEGESKRAAYARSACSSVFTSPSIPPFARNRVRPSLTTAPVRAVTNHGGFGRIANRPPPLITGSDRGKGRNGPRSTGALHAVEQQRVVHDADAAADIVEGVSGESAPGQGRGDEADRRPSVDRDRAVPQLSDGALEPGAERFLRGRVDQQVGAEGALQLVVRVRDRGVEEPLPGAGESDDAEHGSEVLGGLQRSRIVVGIELDEQPVAEHEGVGVVVVRLLHPLLGVRVPVGPLRSLRVSTAELRAERVRLRPVRRHDHDLSGDAVVPAVLQAHGRDVLGLEGQIGIRPFAGHHDDRRDTAELGGDRLLQLRAVVAPAPLRRRGIRSPPRDRVEASPQNR